MKYFIIVSTVILTGLFARSTNPDTGCIYDQSTFQAFYYFYTITINGDSVNTNDWVGAFNGNVCVGSLKWDISTCNNNVCSLPVMGNDGTDWTAGYIEPEDIPSYKIFDVSLYF